MKIDYSKATAVDGAAYDGYCYDYKTREMKRVFFAVAAAVPTYAVLTYRAALYAEELEPLEAPIEAPSATAAMAELEELAALLSGGEVCIFDGMPRDICGVNIAVVKKPVRPPPGYAAIQAGLAYILAPEGAEVDVEKTLALNALAHAAATDVRRYVERRVVASGCLRPHGSHPYPEHWLYSRE